MVTLSPQLGCRLKFQFMAFFDGQHEHIVLDLHALFKYEHAECQHLRDEQQLSQRFGRQLARQGSDESVFEQCQ